ncbi:hypothetical protein M3J09_000373 [Ascochyta lentis]
MDGVSLMQSRPASDALADSCQYCGTAPGQDSEPSWLLWQAPYNDGNAAAHFNQHAIERLARCRRRR